MLRVSKPCLPAQSCTANWPIAYRRPPGAQAKNRPAHTAPLSAQAPGGHPCLLGGQLPNREGSTATRSGRKGEAERSGIPGASPCTREISGRGSRRARQERQAQPAAARTPHFYETKRVAPFESDRLTALEKTGPVKLSFGKHDRKNSIRVDPRFRVAHHQFPANLSLQFNRRF